MNLHPVNEQRVLAFLEAASGLVDEAMNKLELEKHTLVVERLQKREGFVGLSMTFDPVQVRIVLQDEHGRILSEIGTLSTVGEQSQLVN